MSPQRMIAAMVALILPVPAAAALALAPPAALVADPPADAAHPAATIGLVIRSGGAGLNAVMYRAAGAGPHPTLVLLHGFPGYEPNLDLAQAARRAGWNVLTFHYRGAWGSGGAFSFAHCLEDAAAVLAWARSPGAAARFGIDTGRIALAGHSMGGLVAARAAADDRAVRGAFLIDPVDFAAVRRSFADPAKREAFLVDEVRGDLPPLAGTSEAAIMDEIAQSGPALDLVAAMPALAGRPLAIIGAARGLGTMGEAAAARARAAGAHALTAETLTTDHSFSDSRVALATRLLAWLDRLR